MKEGEKKREDSTQSRFADDDDLWENFRPSKKRKVEAVVDDDDKKNSEITPKTQQGRKCLKTTVKNVAGKVKRKVQKLQRKYSPIKLINEENGEDLVDDKNVAEEGKIGLEHCPNCQVPFNILKVKSQTHINKCIDSFNYSSECPDGVDCISNKPEHYERHSHFTLAQWRTSKQVIPQDELKDSDDNSTIKSQNISSNSETSNSLMAPITDKTVSPNSKKSVNSSSFSQRDIRSFFTSPSKKKNEAGVSKPALVVTSDSSLKKVQWEVQWWKTSTVETKDEKCSGGDSTKGRKKSENGEKPETEPQINCSRKTKTCPFYKIISGSTFSVDAFSYGKIPNIQAYFLSHFHYDHYQGLGKKFCLPIYCSKVTASLVELQLRVDKRYLNSLPLNETCEVHGVETILLEANHCPGAVMFYFRFPNGQTVLHTGDFRADSTMERYESLLKNKVDVLYLDTTYCDPVYDFPSQEDTVDFAMSLAESSLNENTLFVCGSYTIGKEKIFLAVAKVLKSKVCALPQKLRILRCLHDPDLSSLLTTNWAEAQVHVLPMNKLNFKALNEHLKAYENIYSNIIAIRPTGWEFKKNVSLNNIKPKCSGPIKIYGVPYSEHSSYSELKRFIQFLRPHKILPTVNNGSSESRAKMDKIFKSWLK